VSILIKEGKEFGATVYHKMNGGNEILQGRDKTLKSCVTTIYYDDSKTRTTTKCSTFFTLFPENKENK